jgi:predicted lipoprotein with Yx(FWY)xxD motif
MSSSLSLRRLMRVARITVPLAVVAVLAAACGSSGGSSSGGTSNQATSTAGPVMVATHSGPVGTYLVDGSGRALYVFASDTSSASTCTGACATAWPPVIVSGKATAGSGVTASDLGTTKRADGATQVTYAGHPLYFYIGDASAGQTAGQGSNNYGGVWWIVDPSGNAIKTPLPASP